MWNRTSAPVFGLLTLAVFLIHALNYLYFFVDDEAIPFVYARHLLEGRGLVYNSLEGRVEGFSDFLHILLAALYLQLGRLLGAGPLAVFFIAKTVSFASGAATVAVIWKALQRQITIRPPGLLAGMAFLVLAPPLAIWSCSSLEMATATLLVALITIAVFEDVRTGDRLIAVAACLLILLRIDGFVYVLASIAPAWLSATGERRREMQVRVLIPVAIVLAGFNLWRIWYFGDWLPAPVAAKVLHKLHPTQNLVVYEPPASYMVAFLRMYGVLPAIVGLGLVVAAVRNQRKAWPLLTSACLLMAYAALVGDWMFGFRFFLPVLPAIAVLIALAVSSIARRRVAWIAAVVACAWFSVAAIRGAAAYERLDYRQGWWSAPSFDPQRYFGPYFHVYNGVRGLIRPGALIAYNQAGFVSYMLDVENIDDLGICSRFIARMPTSDVIFTEVGRYSPLTNASALRTANAYLLYRSPDYVIAPLGNLRAANSGQIPQRILRNHYVKLFAVPHAPAVVYGRSPESIAASSLSAHAFLENLAHPSRIQYASSDGMIPTDEYLARLSFLAAGTLDRTFSGRIGYDVVFASTNEPTYELDLERIWARTEVTMVLTLWTADGAIVRRETRNIAAAHPERVALSWPDGAGTARLTLELDAKSAPLTRVRLRDLRVQGQPVALARYVEQLSFPPAATR